MTAASCLVVNGVAYRRGVVRVKRCAMNVREALDDQQLRFHFSGKRSEYQASWSENSRREMYACVALWSDALMNS